MLRDETKSKTEPAGKTTFAHSFIPTSDEPDENWSISLVYASKSLITGITPTKKASCSGLAKFLGRSVDNQVSKSP